MIVELHLRLEMAELGVMLRRHGQGKGGMAQTSQEM